MNRTIEKRRGIPPGPRRSGLALIDLAMAVMILGILAAVATPRFFGALESHRSRSAARKLAADLNFARDRAIAGSREQAVRFDLAPSRFAYTLDGIPDPARASATWTVRLWESPWNARLVSMAAGASGALRFDSNGLPNKAGTIVVASGSSQRTITVSATGRVSAP